MKAILLNRVLLFLAFLGLFVAGVLSLGHILGANVPCGGSHECATVASHPASKMFGVPVAYFGFLAYVALAVVTAIRSAKGMRNSGKLVMIGFAISALGTIMSLYLQYQSFMVIKATCIWCMGSAAIMILILIGHAILAQLAESGEAHEGVATSLDKVMLIGLPLALVFGLYLQGTSMKDGDAGLKTSIKLPPGTYEKLIARDANSIGPKNAKLTIVEFADLQCGSCQTHSPMVKAFAQTYPDKVRIIYRHFPLANRHQWAMPAAAVSEYAAEKGKFWDVAMAVMESHRELEGPDELYEIAQKTGLNVADLKKRMTNPEDPAYKRVVVDMDLAGELGIEVTPTFFLISEGGKKIEVASSRDILETLQSPKYKDIING
ncbi:MAG: vitamin K epoxide reductase family protein [Fimbriimonas sp.]